MSSVPTDSLARLDRLPRWPWGKKSIVLIGGSFFFSFFDSVVLGVVLGAVLPVIAEEFDVSVATAAIVLTASLVGAVVGGALWLCGDCRRATAGPSRDRSHVGADRRG